MLNFTLRLAALASGLFSAQLFAQASYDAHLPGAQTEPPAPFLVTDVASFDGPWGFDFLPDGRIIVTEKSGHMYVVTNGRKTEITGLPSSVDADGSGGQLGFHDIEVSPTFAQDHIVWFSYVTLASDGRNHLTLANARLVEGQGKARLTRQKIIWQESSTFSMIGQPGARIAFSPDGQFVYLSVGDGNIPDANGDRGFTAQIPTTALGKILRLRLDGTTPEDNPNARAGGVEGQIWASGVRNPYGLAFKEDGSLWESEMGPASGDELNRIEAGSNYGWPRVSNGNHYPSDAYMPGQPYPRHVTDPSFHAPAAYWGWTATTNSMSPSGLVFYKGRMFRSWRNSALLGSMSSTALYRVTFDPSNQVTSVEWYAQDARGATIGRVRYIKVHPLNGSIWYIQDGSPGVLRKLTPVTQAIENP